MVYLIEMQETKHEWVTFHEESNREKAFQLLKGARISNPHNEWRMKPTIKEKYMVV